MYWPQLIFWYAASVPYTLPLAVLTIFAGLMWDRVSRNQAKALPILMIAAGALICFVNAGLALFHMVVQLGILTLSIPALYAFVPKRTRGPYIIVAGAGWLATIASLIAQLTAPGVSIRAIAIAEKWGVPDRSVFTLLSRTATELLYASLEPELLASMILMIALGMILALKFHLGDLPSTHAPFRLSRTPLLFGLCIQLLFLPLLWTHTSDMPQLLGRFSSGFAIVVIANLILTLVFSLMALAASRFNKLLSTHYCTWLIYPIVTLLVVGVLFALTQYRSIHWRAYTYLFFTIQLLLLVLAWQLSASLPSLQARKFAMLAALAYGSSWAVNAPVVFATVHTLPIVPERVLAFLSFSLVTNALIWGVFLGFAIRRHYLVTPIGELALRFLQNLCLVALSVIGIGIAIGQVRHAPLLSTYATEWDARHASIVTKRDRGQRIVEVEPLSSNLSEFMKINANTLACSTDYYGVDARIVDNK